jgi:shikimate dehydrogenase
MNRAAVLGSPIAHSLSPALHTAGYQALGLPDWEYGCFEVKEAGLADFLAEVGAGYRGFSLTMPLKRRALELSAEQTGIATATGAANTLVPLAQGGWLADNTDVPGLANALRPAWQGYREAALLGAGATAVSALFALGRLGVAQVAVHARNPAKAVELQPYAESAQVRLEIRDLAGWPKADEPVLLSTLPAGALEVVPPTAFGGTELFFDVVYWDWPTPLARAAEAGGVQVVSGLEMLVHQAVEQFRLFTGYEAPVEAMFAAVGR